MSRLTLILMFLAYLFNPLVAQTKSEKKAIKTENEYTETKKMIKDGAYSFTADWANTNEGARINLITNPHYFKIHKDSADIFLPYFGTIHSTSISFRGNNGIEFKGVIENLKVKYNDKKRKILIKFDCTIKSERISILLTVQKSGNTNLSITSNIRSYISYDGIIRINNI